MLSSSSSTPVGSRPASPSLQSPVPAMDNIQSPGGSSSANKQPKRANPLIDLIDSERNYVELLAGIIRKVASAWSRANFPPVELDAMFRAVEAVYRANRGLLSKLKDIGPNPSSPKALGDLLMRWVEDLDAPYSRYCNTYTVGYDIWDPVQSNPGLAPLLVALSNANPPPSTPDGPGTSSWTLDMLFALPRMRLKYYKKLYARLLKSTQPGRSDHRLLLGANERLESLLAVATNRMDVFVGDAQETVDNNNESHAGDPPPSPPSNPTLDPATPLPLVPQDAEEPSEEHGAAERASLPGSVGSGSRLPEDRVTSSVSSSSRSERFSRDNTDNERSSRDTATTSISAGRSPSGMSNGGHPQFRSSGAGPSPLSAPSSPPLPPTRSLVALEESLDTTQVLDIFTMRPKPCKLQMSNPVNPLPFVRVVRFEADVVVSFTPKALGEEQIISRAHIVMLTDLFLLCERIDEGPNGGPDLSLCFPPLAARHLKVVDESFGLGPGSENTFQVQVMRKETLVIHTASASDKEHLLREFSDAVEKAIALAPPPRPMPNGGSSGPTSGPASPVTTPNPGPIPPIMLPDQDASFANGPEMGPRSPTTQSFHEVSGTNRDLLSPRNSESGLLNQLSHMGLGGGSDTLLPLSNESSPGAPGGYFPPPRSASFNNGLPPPPPPHGSGYSSPPGPQFSGPPGGPQGYGPGGAFTPGRPPPPPGPNVLHKSPSSRSLGSTRSNHQDGGLLPPLPGMPSQQFPPQNGFGPGGPGQPPYPHLQGRPGPQQQYPYPPNQFPPNQFPPNHFPPNHFPPNQFPPNQFPPNQYPPRSRSQPPPPGPDEFDSPPASPVEQQQAHAITGPTVISAQMKCKVFLKQQHAQWKSLGGARLKLFEQQGGTVVKQLVVEADTKHKDLIISTIVLTDGVERVGRTGVAIELSDKGLRTGVVYMIQLRNETSATGLFDSLLAGSDRTTGGRHGS